MAAPVAVDKERGNGDSLAPEQHADVPGTPPLAAHIGRGPATGVLGSLLRTGGFAALFLFAEVCGRVEWSAAAGAWVVWPAAGVAAAWFTAQRAARTRRVDAVALVAVIVGVNLAVGASVAVAVACVVVGLTQVGVFLRLLSAGYPGSDDLPQLGGPRDLWRLLAAVGGATVCGAAVGAVGLWLVTGTVPWSMIAAMWTGDFANMLLFAAVAMHVMAMVSGRRVHGSLAAGWSRASRARKCTRVGECLAVTVCSLAGYGIALRTPGVSMVFPLIVLTVWAAVRLCTSYVALHSLAAMVATSMVTVHGNGPFAHVGSLLTATMVGQVFIATITLIGLALALGRDEREALTEALAEEKDRAFQQAGLLNAVVNSMADGLAVVGPDGQAVLRNPMMQSLLGDRPAQTTEPDVIGHYGLHDIDGNPVTDVDLPSRKAIADGRTHAADIIVRDPDLREDRIIRSTASPLADADGRIRSAVVLLRDITAERRHRDELASFAGVVAHDLLNPLATVEGWTEAVGDALTDAPEHPAVAEAHAGLIRVTRASARMRGLVNDLLAYTTTRDAAITPVPVDLGHLVADITEARIDAAMAADKPVPDFTVGDLHPVQADPILLRQLLDNLVSNAVKYTAPGVTPHLTITSNLDGDTVGVTIADNGIGIPAGHHDAVFDTFHRAHRGNGYGGTGLGLAICKRTVERHGGTITATDNPGGGTRFTFTLPAATITPAGTISPPALSAIPGTGTRHPAALAA
ncbi:ATP-binding protein [Krasilnikovia sp. MM14-A1259]|uniref:ATP-binding protein n=1 Tax=Krasilnikovia sp. MM14-A1259 TaxID=3373539 RepID=UPI003802F7B5